MNKMMKQVAKMQNELAKAQEELAGEEVQGTSGGGMVTVTMTGAGEFTAVRIDPEAIDPDDPSLIEDLILAAIHEAHRAQQELTASRLGPLTGGLAIPGM
ncbi:MAG: YbaB/EbfC family nucleoid-associated protein [Actinomycetota bacterium]